MDWKQCVICQKPQKETLKCPTNSKRKDASAGYDTLVGDAVEFEKLGIVVIKQFDLTRQESSKILFDNKASWHKSCRDLFNDTKLQRTKKRTVADVEEEEDNDDDNRSKSPLSPVKSRISSSGCFNPQKLQCFFCEEDDTPENLHCASTLEITRNVHDCARLLSDNKLIAELSSGDLVAVEAKYNRNCLANLYNKARPFRNQTLKPSPNDDASFNLDQLAFVELIAYIEESFEENNPAVLKLSDMVKFSSLSYRN